MSMGIVIVFVVVAALAIMVVASQRQSVNKMRALLRQAQEKTLQLEQKVEASREDLKKNKDELERGRSALSEARELNKKKLRRQAEQDHQNSDNEASMTNKMIDDSQMALNALEAQIEQLKKERGQGEELIRTQVEQEFNKKLEATTKEAGDLKKKISELQEELKKQKRMLRPEGNKIDLKTLPDEAAGEFARLFRKAEQHERLHGIARAKLQLAQEKFTDLQKRYFSVCRELAVSVGKNEDIDVKEARDVAEKIVVEHEQESATVHHHDDTAEKNA
jgi:DNA repair exonuclease SbcCD ATPase subunit